MLIGPANRILVAMPLQNIHPDLKLGLVLVAVAAALLKFANSNVLLAFVAAQRLNIVPESFGWLMLAGGIGGLAVVGAAIWVDWRPPHILMAGGAVVVALSLTVVGLSNSFVVSALGMFVAGVGGSAVGSLVFYAVAVKSATRYRGTLIGALGLVFTMSLGVGDVGDWLFDSPMLLLAVSGALTLAGAAVLFLLLPRVFAGSYEPGPTLRETLSMPSVRRAAAWITAAFFIAALVRVSGHYIPFFIARSASGVEDITLPFQAISIFSGIGALLWGVASDFYPARRLFLLAALLILAVLAAFWPFFGYPASAVEYLAFLLISGGLISLPWVLMAELLPPRHFAKMALGISVGGYLGAGLGTNFLATVMFFWSDYVVFWGADLGFWLVLVASIILAIVASRMPRPPATETPAG